MNADIARTPGTRGGARDVTLAARKTLRALARRPLAATLALVVVCLVAFLPGIASIPPVDRDEPRYTQATKQMIETGDVVDIRFQDDPRHKKPVGIHWLQLAAATLTGHGAEAPIWVYRLPSLLGAIAAVLFTVLAARAFLPAGPALLAGLLVAVTMILAFEARIAKTDAVLVATIVAAQAALARIWLAGRTARSAAAARLAFLGPPLALWLALAAGTLVKGPIAPMIVGLTVVALAVLDGPRRHWLAGLRPGPGLLVLAVLAGPWFVAIGVATDGTFYEAALGGDFLGKTQGGAEGHWGPPGTHIVAFLVVGWPLSAVAALALPAMIALRRTTVGVFAIAWVVPTFLVFELVPTKLPHYTLPAYPGIALLAAAALADPAFRSGTLWRRFAAAALLLVPLAAFAAAIVLPLLLSDPIPWAGVAVAGIGLALAVATARAILKAGAGLPAIAGTTATALLFYVAAWGLVLPSLSTAWLAPRLAAAVESASACPDPVPISPSYREPSLVFLTRTDARLVGPREAARLLAELPCAIAAVDERHAEPFREAASAEGLVLVERGSLAGFNISKGDFLDLSLYQPLR